MPIEVWLFLPVLLVWAVVCDSQVAASILVRLGYRPKMPIHAPTVQPGVPLTFPYTEIRSPTFVPIVDRDLVVCRYPRFVGSRRRLRWDARMGVWRCAGIALREVRA